MLNSKQRAVLKGLANGLESVCHVGKGGVTPPVTQSVSEALEARELIKVTILASALLSEDGELSIADVGRMLSERTRSELVQIIGKKVVLYKKNTKNSKINI